MLEIRLKLLYKARSKKCLHSFKSEVIAEMAKREVSRVEFVIEIGYANNGDGSWTDKKTGMTKVPTIFSRKKGPSLKRKGRRKREIEREGWNHWSVQFA